MSSASNARLLKAAANCLSQGKPNTYGAPVRFSGSLSEFSEFDHFRSKSPLPFPVKPLLIKPLPVSTSGRILSHTADLVFDSLFCMFDSFLQFNSCLRSSIHFSPGSIDVSAVGFISVRFALFVCSSIHFYEVRVICVRFDLFLCRFDSTFAQFDSFFGPFDLFLRGSIHFLLF